MRYIILAAIIISTIGIVKANKIGNIKHLAFVQESAKSDTDVADLKDYQIVCIAASVTNTLIIILGAVISKNLSEGFNQIPIIFIVIWFSIVIINIIIYIAYFEKAKQIKIGLTDKNAELERAYFKQQRILAEQRREYEQKEKRVVQLSETYRKLKELFTEVKTFKNSEKIEAFNLNQYKQLSQPNYLVKHHFEKIVKIKNEQIALKNKFTALKNIRLHIDDADVEQFENKIIADIEKEINTDKIKYIDLKVYYTSPAGRNHYSKVVRIVD